LYLVGILFPHINDDARSESLQICISYDIQPPFNEGRTLTILGELLQVLLQICASSY